MSQTLKPLYSGAANAITITLASLANNAYRQATAVDNTTNLYQEAHVTGFIKTGAAGVSATGSVTLYLAGFDGTEYGSNATGTDGSFTPALQANLLAICTIGATANATTYYFPSIYIAQAAGMLWLPQKWALILLNATGAALDATAGNFTLEYQGMNLQAV
jgi:hypothetical protein